MKPLKKKYSQFGGITIDKQVFGLATEISHSFDRLPMDGVMGLAWPALSSFKVTPPMQAILDDLDFPMMTIYMNGYVLYCVIATQHIICF